MLRYLLSIILLILLSFTLAVAQSDALKSDLTNTFKKVAVVRLNTRQALRRTEAGQSLTIATPEKTFELSLTPRDLRSPQYIAKDTNENGLHNLERTPVTTFKGKVLGATNSEVRLSLDGTKIEGFLAVGGERFFIEPASHYSKLADSQDFVVFQEKDLLQNRNFMCPGGLGEKIESGQDFVASQMTESTQTLRVVKIATEADFEYVNLMGGAGAANTEILHILNMVEGVYENELGVTLSVGFQHTWTTQDPFGGAGADPFLRSFMNYWNANFPVTQYPRNTAHLFTAKTNFMAQGYAFIGVLCNNPSFAYGMSGRIYPEWNWEEGNFLMTGHEIGHNLGANHSDTMPNCSNSLMNAVIGGSTQFSFCSSSRTEISNFVSANGACLSNRSFAKFDFDGDGKTDISIFRPSSGDWWYQKSSNGGSYAARFGNSSDKLTPGDYTGDGKADIAIWRPSTGEWFILRSEDSSFYAFPFGTSGDIPAPGDFDGDGKFDQAVFRPADSTWYIRRSSDGGTTIRQFGAVGDVPVVADYDGDGKTDIAIYRPSNGQWWLNRSVNGVIAFQFGSGSDKPVPGDFTGDGKADVAIWRPTDGNWFILRSEDSSFYAFPFGTTGDVPAPGDFDGDGKFDAAVFRPSNSTWFVQRSTAGTLIQSFGQSGDKPIPNSFVP